MHSKLHMIVKFEIKEEDIAYVKSALLKIVDPTRQEEGCVCYDLHQDINNPSILMFYEVWETVDAWKKHDATPHIAQFRKAIEGIDIKITFHKLALL